MVVDTNGADEIIFAATCIPGLAWAAATTLAEYRTKMATRRSIRVAANVAAAVFLVAVLPIAFTAWTAREDLVGLTRIEMTTWAIALTGVLALSLLAALVRENRLDAGGHVVAGGGDAT